MAFWAETPLDSVRMTVYDRRGRVIAAFLRLANVSEVKL